MFKIFFVLVFGFLVVACGEVLVEEEPLAFVAGAVYVAEEDLPPGPVGPVRLTLYVFDDCGGCGVGAQGCGTCDVHDRLHLQMLSQFGGRLHDGSIEYRLFNTRIFGHEDTRLELSERFGVPEDRLLELPVAFIGEDSGIFLIGDNMMYHVQEMFDRYISGEDPETIKDDVMSIMNY